MAIISKIDKSADLVFGLSERMDIDLGTKILADPEQAAKEYRAMVLRCTACSDPEACAKLQQENTHLDEAPDYCRNRQEFNSMRVK